MTHGNKSGKSGLDILDSKKALGKKLCYYFSIRLDIIDNHFRIVQDGK
jgi:hypothetical protein